MSRLVKILAVILVLCSYQTNSQDTVFDKFDRLISYPNKIEVQCPKQTKQTGVLLVIGQSNSANHAQKKMVSRYKGHAYNYFQGKCYEAASPFLGTTGENGEFMTPLADYLIEFGIYNDVVIIPSGINGTRIDYWQKGGKLNNMLMSVLEEAQSKYELTEIVWHQGESDFLEKTTAENYKKSFYSLLATLRKGKTKIPFYYAIATRCSPIWSSNNQIAQMQQTLANEEEKIYLSANTDSLVLTDERIDGFCHFKESGQLKTAYAFAMEILQVRGIQ